VIGNLREVAKRLARGRACISVVSDHGIVKDWFIFGFIPAKPRPQKESSNVLDSLMREVRYASERISFRFADSVGPTSGESTGAGAGR